MEPLENQKELQTSCQNRVRRSDSTAKLDEALAKATLEFTEVLKENENPFYKSKYADLSAVLAATRSALAKHGVTLRQWPFMEDLRVGITSRLCCAGEWEESDCALPLTGKQDAQAVGSALTYIRRYATQSILAVAAESDDDANAAVVQKTKAAEKRFEDARISQENVREFWQIARKAQKTNQQIADYLKSLGYLQTEELKQVQYEAAKDWAAKPIRIPVTAAIPEPQDLTGTLQASLDMAKAKKKAVDPFWASLWASAKKHGVSEDDVHQYAREKFDMPKLESLKELSQVQLGKVIEWLASVEA